MQKSEIAVADADRLPIVLGVEKMSESPAIWQGQIIPDNGESSIIYIQYKMGTISCGIGMDAKIAKQNIRPYACVGEPTDNCLDTNDMIQALHGYLSFR